MQKNFDKIQENFRPLFLDPEQNQVCNKCRESWVPGHRQVCKMSQRAQIQALQAQDNDTSEIIYVTDFEDPEQTEPPPDNTVLQLSMHAATGIGVAEKTFILSVKIGSTIAIALVDSGSTNLCIT